MTPLEQLRHHVTGAIERGEAEPIVECPPLPRESSVEEALKWAKRQGYSCADYALNDYCNARGLVWSDDYRGIVSIKESIE